MFSAVVRRNSTGTDGVPDQEAAGRGGNALREGTHLPAGQVCGQDPQETLLGKTDGWYQKNEGELDMETERQKWLKSEIDSFF